MRQHSLFSVVGTHLALFTLFSLLHQQKNFSYTGACVIIKTILWKNRHILEVRLLVMIDQERVREMTKLAAYEQREGKKYKKAVCYYRSDFAVRHLLKGFFCGTAVFGIFLVLWGVCHLEELMANIDSMDLIALGTAILVRYLCFLGAYLVAVYIYANVFYASGRKSMKRHYRRLKRLGRLYEEQESRTAPTRH